MHITKESLQTRERTCYGHVQTEQLIKEISKANGYLSVIDTAIHMEAGSTIYGTFYKYYKTSISKLEGRA